MAKRVFIGVGHGGNDPGAIGYVREEDANLTIALEMRNILQANGYIVGISRTKDENDTLREEIKEANAFDPDLALDVHNNAGGGDGFEVWVQTNGYAAESRAAGKAIENRVKALGQNSRGVKTKKSSSGADYYGFLRQVNAPALILEGFFVDNSKDAADFDTSAELKELAKAYALGVMDYLGESKPEEKVEAEEPQDKPVSDDKYYRIRKTWEDKASQKGAYRSLENAKADCPDGYTVFDWNGKAVYSKAEATVAPDPARQFNQGRAGTYQVKSSDGTLNLRAGAHVSKQLIETMKNGDNVRCYGYHTGDWLFVVSPTGKQGYCHSGYLVKLQ